MMPTSPASSRWRVDAATAPPDQFAEEHLAGTVGEVVERMGEYAEAGCYEMILYFYDMGVYDSLELFAGEVIPEIRT